MLSDRGAAIDGEQLKTLSIEMERPVVQRLGYLLDRLGHDQVSNSMYSSLVATGTPRWTELDRTEASDPDFAPELLERNERNERNERWKVTVRQHP